ncbi:hypothetical protein [Actinomycetospora flava]|uniref:Uncharacterized protein n=1 Tax=Actinomycetospora flava TaxID=3129232 RepID=A0ABU8LZN7_9PSEU
MRWTALLGLLVALLACTPDVERPPTPEQVDRALRFAALAPLPVGGVVTRLETQGGIDTQVVITVRPGDVQAWRAASGLPSDDAQQRIANPDGAIVHRSASSGPADVTVTAFTT